MPTGRICVGVITGAHGVRGAVRIKSFTANPADMAAYGPVSDESGARCFDLCVTGAAKGVILAKIEGFADRDAAQALKGLRLYVPRSALPEPEANEFYHRDLIGLRAELTDGTVLGEVTALQNYGAGDILEVLGGEGPPLLVPFTGEVVPVVDIEGGRIVIDPPAGLLEHDESTG